MKPFYDTRRDFPMLAQQMNGHPLIYLDSAATSQKPQVVIDTISHLYQNKYSTAHRALYTLSVHVTEQYEQVRRKVQRFLNAAKPQEIIFTRGATESINIVAHSFGKAFIRPGDEIVISALEHHSNIVPWQMLCEWSGAKLKVIPMNDKAELCLETYAQFLKGNVKLVAITHVANSTGTVNPIKQMIAMAHNAGAKVLIDGAQSAPHMPIDVQDLDADFFVFSGHKIYGPTGIGVLYGKEALLEKMPPHYGGGDMIAHVTFDKTTYNTLPLKFEAGTPLISGVIGLGEALDYVSKLNLNTIHQWEQTLLKHATTQLQQIEGIRILGTASEKSSILTFVIHGLHPLDIGTFLDLQGIAIRTGHLCAQPVLQYFGVSSTCRASFAFYNTLEEIDNFIYNLSKIVKQLK